MDITNISAQFMNPSQNPFSSAQGILQPRESGGFEDILRRMQNSNSTSDISIPAVSGNTAIDKNSELYEVCLELETILIKNLIKGMRNTIQKSGFIDSSFAGEMYEDMLYDEYAKNFARNANLGFAEMAYRELAGLSNSG